MSAAANPSCSREEKYGRPSKGAEGRGAATRRSEIRRLIQEQPRISLELKDDAGTFRKKFPEGVDELHFQVMGVIKDVERLKKLFDLFAEVLEQLHALGSASEEDPGVKL